jgi:CRISPR system Cascade subunit CasE
MFLSRLMLDVRAGHTRRCLSDVNFLHQQVLAAFPEGVSPATPRASLGVLFRFDRLADGRLALLVQSAQRPDWSRFPKSALSDVDAFSAEEANPAVKDVGRLFAALQAGALLRFRLRANPTKKVDTKTGPDGKRRNGRRVALTKEADRLAWLMRKGEQHGFKVLTVDVGGRETPALLDVSEGRAQGYRPGAEEGHGTMTFGSALFDGTLQVTDVEPFRTMLREGIGSGKAFGFGLMSIAKGE